MNNSLLEFWNRCPIKQAPYVHPDDIEFLNLNYNRYIIPQTIRTFSKYKDSATFGRFDDPRFHLSLLPAPYGGNIAKADIIILLLNPGVGFTDYYGETRIPKYRKLQVNNLRQNFSNSDFPFHRLNPEFCWHGGFSWWEKKLRSILTIIADQKYKGCYMDALSSLSRRLAHIELIPYHSASFNAQNLLRTLPSALAAKRYVKETLLPQALKGKRLIIVTRQCAGWDITKKNNNVVLYEGGETRGASLSRQSKGGRAILKRFGINT